LNTDDWHHVGVTHDGSGTYTVYVDGSSVGNASLPTPSTASDSNVLGAQPSISNTRTLDGQLDQSRLYDKALTSTEVSNLYNNGRI